MDQISVKISTKILVDSINTYPIKDKGTNKFHT